MKRLYTLPAIAIFLALTTALQAQAPSSRKVPFNNITTTMTCPPDPSPCQRTVILRMFDAATAGTQVGVDEPQTVSVNDPAGTGGSISFVLGSTRPTGVDPNDFQSGSSLFVDVLDAATLTSVLPGRIELTAVAFAVNPGPQGPQGIQGPQGVQGPTGAQGPAGVIQTVSAGDASIAVGGTAADRLVSIAPNGVTNAHVANGALSPDKIAGKAVTLGSNNNFTGNASFAAGLGVGDVAGFNIATAPAGATESGTLVTITTTAPHSFNSGDLVTISGVAVSGYNGTFYLAVPGSATTFTYVAPTAGLAASGGGTAVSGALLSVNGSPNQVASPLLSITNPADAMASLTLASGLETWSIGANHPPDNPTFRGLFFNRGTFGAAITRMAITTGGNVGIGTMIPSKLLDVAGDGNFNGSVTASSFSGSITTTSLNCTGCVGDTQLGVNYAGSASHGGPAANSLALGGVAPSGYAPAFGSPNYVSKSGDSMFGALRVGGNLITDLNMTATGNMTAGGNLLAGGNLRVEGGVSVGQVGAVSIDASGITGGRLQILSNGNVGIGNINPSAKLDVAGDIKASGKYTGDGSGLSNLSASQFVGGGINPQEVALLKWYGANQTTTFPVGFQPSGVAFDGANIWVANSNPGTVSKLRASDGTLLGTFTVGPNPEGVAFDGANIWVANNTGPGTVTKLRASDGTLLGTFATIGSFPWGVAFDGANIWVANWGSNNVSKLRASDGTLLGTFTVGPKPEGVAFDGVNIWVANYDSNTVSKLRTSDGTLLGTFTVGIGPVGLAFDGANIWVTNAGSQTVSKLRASDGSLLGTFAVGGSGPTAVAFDGANIWVVNSSSSTVSKL